LLRYLLNIYYYGIVFSSYIIMKKAILSPLSSAFVIPGLGQIINQHLKKGVCILAGTFILFIAALVKLYQILCSAMGAEGINHSESGLITERFRAEDFSALWYLLGAFALLWIYSVVDAHRAGRKIDGKQGDHS
jgi:hypothetical protein